MIIICVLHARSGERGGRRDPTPRAASAPGTPARPTEPATACIQKCSLVDLEQESDQMGRKCVVQDTRTNNTGFSVRIKHMMMIDDTGRADMFFWALQRGGGPELPATVT